MSIEARNVLSDNRLSAEEKAKILAEWGYRRVSNTHRIISRIDREDWLNVLSKKISRPVADFYYPNGDLSDMWTDQYRRCYSNDSVERIDAEVFHKIPGSGGDRCDYLPITEYVVKAACRDDIPSVFPQIGTRLKDCNGVNYVVIAITNSANSAQYNHMHMLYTDGKDFFTLPPSRWEHLKSGGELTILKPNR